MGKFYKIKQSSDPKKATAWKNIAKFIKLRDAIKTTGDIYHAKCITCGEIKPIEDMDAGHGIPGRMNSILFNEDLVNAQCRQCNRHGSGELQMYKRVLIDIHGQDKWDYWQSIKNNPVQYTQFDYEQIARTYREKANKLKSAGLLRPWKGRDYDKFNE
jgi:hypothetical protein